MSEEPLVSEAICPLLSSSPHLRHCVTLTLMHCRVVVTAVHTEKDVLKAVTALATAVKEVCKVSRVATRSSYMTNTAAS